MTFDQAMELVEIETALDDLGLSDVDRDYVVEAHALIGSRLLRAMLRVGGDHIAYVRRLLVIRDR